MLEVSELNVAFASGDCPVQSMSFSIAGEERVALVGESGAGKTVTALALLRLLPPATRQSGSVVLDGRELSALSERAMNEVRGRLVSMIFQEPASALNPVLTIGTQIVEVMRRHLKLKRQLARTMAIEMLDRAGLPDPQKRMRDYPHQLSGGMRQRVMIAMALACRPRLLIADEPSTALDVPTQAKVLTSLVELTRDSGTALLLITHDMGLVRDYCQRALVMRAGNILETVSVNDLFKRPQHPYTASLLSGAAYS